MSIESRALFEEIWKRVQTIPTIKTLAQTPMYTVKKEDLPRMMATYGTDMPAWGDPTSGPIKFDATMTVYFSYVLAGSLDDNDLILMDETMDLVEAVLFTDPKFVRQIRGVQHITRQQPNFSQVQETNVAELRESIAFLHHQIVYSPTIEDYFATLSVITKTTPSGVPPDKFTIFRKWDIPQE